MSGIAIIYIDKLVPVFTSVEASLYQHCAYDFNGIINLAINVANYVRNISTTVTKPPYEEVDKIASGHFLL